MPVQPVPVAKKPHAISKLVNIFLGKHDDSTPDSNHDRNVAEAVVVVHEYGAPGAPPMVLLHGLTEAGTTWPDAVEHWGAHWRMLAVDLRGHGDSPRFADEELADTAAVVLADVLRVLDAVRRPVALVGHSYGALFALRSALARPDLVRGLVLEDPARPIDLRPEPPEFFEHQDRFLDAMLTPAFRPATPRQADGPPHRRHCASVSRAA